MVDSIRALELAGKLVVAFPGRNVTEDHAKAWADALEPLNEIDAVRVVALLQRRSVDPPSVAQVGHTIAEVRGQTMSPDYYGGGYRCVFMDGVPCPACSTRDAGGVIVEPVVHGRLLTHAEQRERWAELTAKNANLKPCPICDVVHIRRTHEQHVASVLAAARRAQVTRVGREV